MDPANGFNGEGYGQKKKAGHCRVGVVCIPGRHCFVFSVGRLVERDMEMNKGLYVATLAFVWYFAGNLPEEHKPAVFTKGVAVQVFVLFHIL